MSRQIANENEIKDFTEYLKTNKAQRLDITEDDEDNMHFILAEYKGGLRVQFTLRPVAPNFLQWDIHLRDIWEVHNGISESSKELEVELLKISDKAKEEKLVGKSMIDKFKHYGVIYSQPKPTKSAGSGERIEPKSDPIDILAICIIIFFCLLIVGGIIYTNI